MTKTPMTLFKVEMEQTTDKQALFYGQDMDLDWVRYLNKTSWLQKKGLGDEYIIIGIEGSPFGFDGAEPCFLSVGLKEGE